MSSPRAVVCAVATFTTLSFAAASQPSAQYAGTKVYHVSTGGQEQTDRVANLINPLGRPTLPDARIPDSHVNVQVSKNHPDGFHQALKQVSPVLHSRLVKEDQGITPSTPDASAGLANDAWFRSYHAYANHLTFVNDLTSKFPNNCKPVSVGNTYEGRTINGIHIFGSSGSGTKPAVIFHGASDPSAWITTMVTEYIAYSLLSDYTTNKSYIDEHDIYIIPIANPDGFVYTQSTDRKWPRNRQPPIPGSTCSGVYLDLNWDYRWGTARPCFADSGAFACDSPECQGLSAFLNSRAKLTKSPKLFINFDGGELTIWNPTPHDCSTMDTGEQLKLMQGFAAAFKVQGLTTRVLDGRCGSPGASGHSIDYAYSVSGIKFSFGLNIPEVSGDGRTLPSAEFKRLGTGVYEGVKYLLANIQSGDE